VPRRDGLGFGVFLLFFSTRGLLGKVHEALLDERRDSTGRCRNFVAPTVRLSGLGTEERVTSNKLAANLFFHFFRDPHMTL